MARFLRTVIHQDVTVTAAGTPIETNLGVNPISFLLVTIRAVISAANARTRSFCSYKTGAHPWTVSYSPRS